MVKMSKFDSSFLIVLVFLSMLGNALQALELDNASRAYKELLKEAEVLTQRIEVMEVVCGE